MSWLARLISGESDEEYFARCPDEPYRVTHDGRTVANPARTAALIREFAMGFYKTQDCPNRKDWRKEGPAAESCKPHGSCPYCRSNRTHSTRKRIESAEAEA